VCKNIKVSSYNVSSVKEEVVNHIQ